MADVTVIGRGTRVRGRVGGAVDLEVHGHIEGEVAIDGELTVEATGLIGAELSARRVVVRGAVRGDINAEEAVFLEEGSRVVGDLRAPRVTIADGALYRGELHVGGLEPRKPKVVAAAPGRHAPAHAMPRPAPVAVRAPAPAPMAPPPPPRAMPAPVQAAPPPAPAPVVVSEEVRRDEEEEAQPESRAVAHNPPPPAVPAIKKGARGQFAKKR